MKWGTLASLTPVVFFALSIPVAFLVDTTLAALTGPGHPRLEIFDRRRPPGVADELGDLT